MIKLPRAEEIGQNPARARRAVSGKVASITGSNLVTVMRDASGGMADQKPLRVARAVVDLSSLSVNDPVAVLPVGDLNEEIVVPYGPIPAAQGVAGYKLLPLDFPSAQTEVGVGAANQVRAFRFYMPFRLLVSRIIYEIATLGTTTTSRTSVGIYSDDGLTKLIDSGALQSDNPDDVKNVDVSDVTVGLAFYWLAWCANESTPVTFKAQTIAAEGDDVLNAGRVELGTAAEAGSNGALPSTLGTISAGAFPVPFCKLSS